LVYQTGFLRRTKRGLGIDACLFTWVTIGRGICSDVIHLERLLNYQEALLEVRRKIKADNGLINLPVAVASM